MVPLSTFMTKNHINEVYYIFRGTEPSKDFGDVVYDALGIGSGERNNQVQDAKVMYEEVEKKLKAQIQK